MRGILAGVLVAASVVLVADVPPSASLEASDHLLIDTAPDGTLGNDRGGGVAVDDTGTWVAFQSSATNLVPAGTTPGSLYVRNTATGAVELISVTVAGSSGPGGFPSISSDGRYVTFESGGTNLVPNDTNATRDLFLRDRVLGTTERVNLRNDGTQSNRHLYSHCGLRSAISDDGRYVVFCSTDSTLAANDSNGEMIDVFVRDRQLGTTTLISTDAGGAGINAHSFYGAISADGSTIGFVTSAALVPEDTNTRNDVYVRSLTPGSPPRLVSVRGTGTAQHAGGPLDMSSDGRVILFSSESPDLVPGDTNAAKDIFVRDMDLETVERVSVDSAGTQGPSGYFGDMSLAMMSDDARYVFFKSNGKLTPGPRWPFVVRDRLAQSTERLEFTPFPDNYPDFTTSLDISGDGRRVAYDASTPTFTSDGKTHVVMFDFAARRRLMGGPLSPREALGANPAAPHACWCHGRAGDPIDTRSGNFHHSFRDIDIASRGPDLAFERSYNSLSAAEGGALGYGWTHNWNVGLSVNASTGDVTIRQESGSEVMFHPLGGGYDAPARVTATLVHNPNGSWTFTRAGGEVLQFSSVGNLISVGDRYGDSASLSYSGGQLTSVTDETGRALQFTWSGGRIASISDPASPARAVQFYYDSSGNLVRAVDVTGGTSRFTYDTSHRLTTMQSQRFEGASPPRVVENHYDSSGRVDWQRDPLGRTTVFDYTSIANATMVTDPRGNVAVDYYDADNLRVARTEGYGTAASATWTFDYDPVTLGRTEVTDPAGRLDEQTSYDVSGWPVRTADAAGRIVEITYTSFGQPLTVTRPSGLSAQRVTTTLSYNSAGLLNSQTTPLLAADGTTIDEQVVLYFYDDASHPTDITRMVDPRGKTWTYTYDVHGNRTSIVDPEGNKTSTTYNVLGWVTSRTAPKGNLTPGTPDDHMTELSYNSFGDVTRIEDATGAVVTRGYDPDRHLIELVEPGPLTTTYEYDDAGQLVTVVRPDDSVTRTEYWPDGTVKRQIDAAEQATSFDHDSLGRLTSITDPIGRTTSFRHSPAGTVLWRQDPGGSCTSPTPTGCTTFSYDSADQLTSIDYADPATPDVTAITYDGAGRRAAQTDGHGTSAWSYDSLGRLTRHVGAVGMTTDYGYDIAGNITSMAYPGGGTVTRAYDDAGRWTAVTDFDGRTTTFDYDANSNLSSTAFPTDAQNLDAYSYDAADRQTSTSFARAGTTYASLAYTRTPGGLVDTATSTGLPETTALYDYTDLDQLASVRGAPLSYDTAGNLTRLEDGRTQTFDAANQLVSADQAISFVGASSGTDLLSASVAQPLPAGLQADDQVLVAISLPENQSVTSAPAGYDQISNLSSGSGGTRLVLYRRTANGADPTPSFGFSGSGLFPKALAVVAYRGVDPITPVDATGTGTTGGGTSVTVGSIITTRPGDRLIMAEGATGNLTDGTFTQPPGMTPRANPSVAGGAAAGLADQPLGAPGATGSRTATFTTAQPLAAAAVALRPARATYGFDVRGNRTNTTLPNGSVINMGYDSASRLTSYSNVATYAYNGDGSRVSKTVSGAKTWFSWNMASELPLLLLEAPDNGAGGPDLAAATRYVYGPGNRVVAQVKALSITEVSQGSASDVLNAGSLTVNLPGLIKDDQIIAATVVPQGQTISAPAGYTTVENRVSGAARLVVFRKRAIGGETGVTVTYPTGVYSKALLATAYRGVDPTAAIDALSYGVASGTSVTAPSISSTVRGDRIVMIEGATGNLPIAAWTQPAGMTERVAKSDVSVAIAAGDQALGAPGPTGAKTATFSQSHPLVGVLIALKRAPLPTLYHHQDQLGSTRVLTDHTGQVQATFSYDAYGTMSASTGTARSPFLFAGEYTDTETGFQYLRARYYDGGTGQFLTRDPLEAVTRAPYSYASNDPVNNVDPTGLDTCGRPQGVLGLFGSLVDCVANPTDLVDQNVDTANQVVDTVSDHPGASATVAATAWCFVPAVGWTSCAWAQGGALGVRSAEAARDDGWDAAKGITLDAIFTYATAGLFGWAFDDLGRYAGRLIPVGYDMTLLWDMCFGDG